MEGRFTSPPIRALHGLNRSTIRSPIGLRWHRRRMEPNWWQQQEEQAGQARSTLRRIQEPIGRRPAPQSPTGLPWPPRRMEAKWWQRGFISFLAVALIQRFTFPRTRGALGLRLALPTHSGIPPLLRPTARGWSSVALAE